MNINPNIKSRWNKSYQLKSVDYYYKGIISQDRFILSEAISLVENKVHRYNPIVIELLDKCYNTPSSSLRIGITGSPGVGKSSFIESLGMDIIGQKKKKIAVLAIDPSSTITQGSILGDKTRMVELSNHTNAFIRPSPSENYLGGVSSATKEIITLCEAAAYDYILIETVGVGQSETLVSELVDMFILLLLPGAGDEIQGIKRGIVEMADMIIVNKSDGDRVQLSKLIQKNYKNAIHLFQAKDHGQVVQVMRCSSLSKEGIDGILEEINGFHEAIVDNNYLVKQRGDQDQKWFSKNVIYLLERLILNEKKHKNTFDKLKNSIGEDNFSPYKAILEFNNFIHQKT